MDSMHSWDQCDRGHRCSMPTISQTPPHPAILTVLHFTFNQCHFLLSAFIPLTRLCDLFGSTFPQSQTFCCQGKTASLSKAKVLLKWLYHHREELHLFATSHCRYIFPQNIRFTHISEFSSVLYQNIPSLKAFFIGKDRKESCDNLNWVKWVQPNFNLSLNSVHHFLKAQFAVICS